jgi:hypothetical protein
MVPLYGSHATRRPFPSVAVAIAPPVSSSRSTAASALSGRRTVREPTTESYCSNAQRFDAMLGDASSARRTSDGSATSPPGPAAASTRSARTSSVG